MGWLRKILRVPPGTNLVYFLIEKQKGPIKQICAFVAFFILFYLLFGGVAGAVAMILAMYLHELGHFVVFVANGVKSIILFLFPLGAVAAPVNDEENKRSDLLPWWNIATLLQAGPTVNVILMVIGVILVRVGIWPAFGRDLVTINGVLAFFNLLPLWNMDGGQLFHVICSSLKEQYDIILAIFGIVVCAAILAVLLASPISQGMYSTLWVLYKSSGLILFLLLFAAGVWQKQGKDNPLHSASGQAMNVKQVIIQLGWYTCLIVVTFLLLNLPL
jgi:Zn-dependent protease